RRPGADVEFTGKKFARGSFTIPLADIPELVRRYGTPFALYRRLLTKFTETPIGELVHPLKGHLTAAIGDVREAISEDKRNLITLQVSWVEQNATGQAVLELRDDDSRTTPQTAAQRADDAASSARIAGYSPTAPTVDAQLATLPSAPTYGQVSAA